MIPANRMQHLTVRSGFTIVELLIAALILTVVLGLGTTFLAQQTTLQRAVQARNDVQDRVRVVMQIITQDLTLAGNATLVDTSGAVLREAPGLCRNVASPNVDETCVTVTSPAPDPGPSSLAVRYLSSQFPAGEECRDVAYTIVGDSLMRSDVQCDATSDPIPFGTGALAFDVRFVCSNGTTVRTYEQSDDCAAGSFPRTAIVTFASRSEIPTRAAASTLTYVGGNIDCAAGGACFVLSQELLVPNLKDN